jgi:hypothetical protein
MNRAKCNELDYIHFLIAAQKTFTCTEAARCQPEHPNAPAHDAFTRLLQRQPLDTEALWQEVQPCVQRQQGLLVIDDTTLDKPYAQKMDYVTYHWSGKHQRVVKGIALMTLLWTDGQALLPCDFRVYDKPFGGASKNTHFRAMLQQAWVRGFAPAYVVMDSWYASLENLKWIASVGWHFVTRLRSNRLVNPDGLGNRPISTVDIPLEGCVVHLKGLVVTPLSSDDAYRSETLPNSKYGRSNLSPSQDSYADNDAQTNNPQHAHANTDANATSCAQTHTIPQPHPTNTPASQTHASCASNSSDDPATPRSTAPREPHTDTLSATPTHNAPPHPPPCPDNDA